MPPSTEALENRTIERLQVSRTTRELLDVRRRG
jgi:hypothetical protein